ncbi:hypothetical protein FRX31_013109 [Thalictrum thalictroides]|uniref:Uncharacterized protein n=1 Tax=Thalictrum thalictroides TaxID=46969 RepID=A0A7J6WIS7_THATH|nr:hypothetical protein FRX31_013109 [Thalictrum thalictroides]
MPGVSLSESDSSHKRISDEELLWTTEKRPRIEEDDDDGSETEEEEPNLVAQPVAVRQKAEERFPPGRIYTYEDLQKDLKTHRCLICDEVGHLKSSCEWANICPTYAVVSPLVEKVCWCCGEAPEKNHPGVPLDEIGLRAQIKR